MGDAQALPTEFALGLQALELIEQQLGLSLPEDEAGFIAWHLANAQLNSEASEMQAINQLMRQILRIVKDQQGLELDEQALNYHRFIAHLKFLRSACCRNSSYKRETPACTRR